MQRTVHLLEIRTGFPREQGPAGRGVGCSVPVRTEDISFVYCLVDFSGRAREKLFWTICFDPRNKQLAVFPTGCWGLESELHRARWRARGQFGDCCYKFLVTMQSLRVEWTSGLSLVLDFFLGAFPGAAFPHVFVYLFVWEGDS